MDIEWQPCINATSEPITKVVFVQLQFDMTSTITKQMSAVAQW